MKRTCQTLLLALILLSASFAFAESDILDDEAENINFSIMSCGEFVGEIESAEEDDLTVVMMWLDGYASGLADGTTLNFKNLETFTEKIIIYCSEHTKENVLHALRKVNFKR